MAVGFGEYICNIYIMCMSFWKSLRADSLVMRGNLQVKTLFTAAEAKEMKQLIWIFGIKVVLTNEWDG